MIWLLFRLGFWSPDLIKDTIFWYFSAIYLAFSFINKKSTKNVGKLVITETIKITLILEFLITTYTLPLIIELIMLPVIIFCVLITTVDSIQSEQLFSKKFKTNIQTIFGWAILFYAIWVTIQNFTDIMSLKAIRTIVFPIILSISFIPFIKGLVLYVSYELVLTRLKMGGAKSLQFQRHSIWLFFRKFGINNSRLRTFFEQNTHAILRAKTISDLRQLLASK